jgi:hypothetical protein
MSIAVLGWGSLLWDHRTEFDEQIGAWQFDGPQLKLEFLRISKTRFGALTLVIDEQHGEACQVAYAISKRRRLEDAIGDLRCREGTVQRRIGYLTNDGQESGEPPVPLTIKHWLHHKGHDAAVWTGLDSNFAQETSEDLAVDRAIEYLANLTIEGKSEAAKYIWRAPAFIQTSLRRAVQIEPWFKA